MLDVLEPFTVEFRTRQFHVLLHGPAVGQILLVLRRINTICDGFLFITPNLKSPVRETKKNI